MASETPTTQQAYQEWLDKGHDLAWAGNWQQAAIAYQRAIDLRGDEPVAHISLGLALYEFGEMRRALVSYQRALQLQPGSVAALQKIADIHARLNEKLQAASSYLALADSYMREKQPAQAVRAWQQVVRYDPVNLTAYRRLADAYKRGRRNDLAAQAILALGRVHAELGNEGEALSLARQAIELQPDFGPAHQFLNLLQSPGSSQAVVGLPARGGTGPLRRTAGTGPLRRGGNTGPLHGSTGSLRPGSTSSLRGATGPLDFDSLQVEGFPGAGREAGSSPIELAQQRALARMAEAVFESDSVDLLIEGMKATAIDLQTRGLVEEAARTYQEIIQAGGGSSEVYYTLGTLYQTMLRFDDAIREFKRVTTEPDFSTAALFAIGQCYQSQGRMDEALSHFLEALKVIDMQTVEHSQADEIIRLYEGLADSYEAKGDQTQAAHFIDLLAEFLTSRGWEDKLHELRARMGSAAEGITLIELLDTTDSELALAAVEVGTYYRSRGLTLAALDELFWALPAAPYYLPLHLLMAELFVDDGRPEDAVSKLVVVAEVYMTRSNPTQAIRALKRALEIAPVDQSVRGKLIDMLMSHGELDEAIDNYIQLAEGFYQLAQGERAIEKLNEALRMAPRGNPEHEWGMKIQRRLADIHMQRLDWRRAVAAYEGIIAMRPQDTDVAQRLSDLYFKLGSDERAVGIIENTADRIMETEGGFAMLRFVQHQVDQRPNDIALVKLHGELQAQVGDNEGAAKSWERAVELMIRKGERVQGIALLRRIVGLRPANEARYRAMLQHLSKG